MHSPQNRVRDGYRENPFHNFRHAFCVTQMMFVVLRRTSARPPNDVHVVSDHNNAHVGPNHNKASHVASGHNNAHVPSDHNNAHVASDHNKASHVVFSARDMAVLMLAAVCHDLDHPATSNA
jgi:hypothetical protein